jgi:hypothetical protein
MSTKKHMGANSLIDRLTAQVGSRDMAIGLLRQRGQMDPKSEKLTAAGEARNRMTAEERAKDRASTLSGKPATQYAYNPNTNRATLKRTKRI